MGVSVLADEDEYEDFTKGVTITCNNGEVALRREHGYDFDQDSNYGDVGFYAIGDLTQTREYTFNLLDDDGVAAEDTQIEITSCSVDLEDIDVCGNILTIGELDNNYYGGVCLIVSSESLGITTYVCFTFYDGEYLEEYWSPWGQYRDYTEDYIMYCNGVEVTTTTNFNVAEVGPSFYLIYYLELEIGETYEIQFANRSTGEMISIIVEDWLWDFYGNIDWYVDDDVDWGVQIIDQIMAVNGDVLTISPVESVDLDGATYNLTDLIGYGFKSVLNVFGDKVYSYEDENGEMLEDYLISTYLYIDYVEPSPDADILLGDVNQDGSVDYLDAMQVLRYDAELVELDEDQLAAGDVNADGEVNSLDAILILRYDAGLIDSFE